MPSSETPPSSASRKAPPIAGPPEPPALSPDQWTFRAAFLILLPCYLAPLFLVRFLPGVELPFHLALGGVLGGDPARYRELFGYEVGLQLSSYQVYYGLLSALSQGLPVLLAHRVVMALYVAALPLGMARLLAACGRSRVPALLGFPLGYNLGFYHGQVHFLLALPLLCFFLGQVADNLDDEYEGEPVNRAFVRDGMLVVLTALLFLCHLELYALGLLLGLCFICFSAAPMVYRIRTGLAFLPSLVLLGWTQAVARGAGDQAALLRSPGEVLSLVRAQRLGEIGSRPLGEALLGDAWARLWALPQHLLRGFQDGAHRTGALLSLSVLAVFFLAGLFGVFVRGDDIDRGLARMKLAGVLAFLLTFAGYLLLPLHLPPLQAVVLAPRCAALAMVLAPLLVPTWLRRFPRWLLCVWTLPAVLALGFYAWDLCSHFGAYDRELRDFASVLDRTPPGGKAVGLVFDRSSKVIQVSSALAGLPSYYPVERARGAMAQPLCGQPLSPCRVADRGKLPPDPGPFTPQNFDPERAVPYFDYFFVRSGPEPARLFGAQAGLLEPLLRAGTWTVYRKRGAAGATPP